MTNPTTSSPLDSHRATVEILWEAGDSYAEIVRKLAAKGVHTSDKSLRRAFRRWQVTPRPAKTTGPEPAGSELDPKEGGTITSVPSSEGITPEELLRLHSLEPSDWEIMSARVSTWDMAGMPQHQLRLNIRPVVSLRLVLPASEAPQYRVARSSARDTSRDDAELVVFVGDHQAPYVNYQLHELFCQFQERNRPDRGCIMGDLVDFPDISRHPENPEWHVKAQVCVQKGYDVLRETVEASEDTEWVMLMGNHDERIRLRLLGHMTNLYGLAPAQKPGEPEELPAWDLRRLLHLGDLGIELLEPNGKYTHAQWNVSPYLAARHGHVARKGSGSSALGTLEEFGFSMVVGHTHRQSLVHKTTHDINGQTTTLAAVETGCMCRIEEGLGYTPAPDWQNGFATAAVWPDGTFKMDLATYVNGTLYWRDQRFN